MHQPESLSTRLLEAYSDTNLNKIARNLIRLYKEKEFEKLNIISGMISEWVEITIEPDGKGFSKIISLYHPDRGEFYRDKIAELVRLNKLATLEKFRHIFVIQDIEEIAANIESFEDIDYHPEYVWDAGSAGFGFHRNNRKNTRHKQRERFDGYTFYEAMQIRQYGDTDTSFPTYYLEDMDEVELSESEISDLDGAEFCVHTISMDLSGNLIADLSPLSSLHGLRELNLSGNKLSYIDALSNLQQLRSVDLSNNEIDDISPLFELSALEYADLTGNRVPQAQIRELRDLGVSVDC
ncbi:MAG: leucine-rich repeat domain-containing protein [Prolixibacteraceae bacterium]|nr:leucine-rich repeat domain-containing protein [Prolixibacteraceae bacterium]